MRIVIAILLIVTSNNLSAQYLHYSDKSNTNKNIQPAKPISDTVTYHNWPDRCPGMPGSIPVLMNYVPRQMVLKLTEIYQGHLYAITSLRIDKDRTHYELKVCVNGVIRFDYADDDGNIIAK